MRKRRRREEDELAGEGYGFHAHEAEAFANSSAKAFSEALIHTARLGEHYWVAYGNPYLPLPEIKE